MPAMRPQRCREEGRPRLPQDPGASATRYAPESGSARLGKLCTGGRAEADGWLSHEADRGESGVGRPIAACEVRGTRPTLHPGLTPRGHRLQPRQSPAPARSSPYHSELVTDELAAAAVQDRWSPDPAHPVLRLAARQEPLDTNPMSDLVHTSRASFSTINSR